MQKPEPTSRTLTSVNTYAAPALEKGFNVIELLATEPQGLTISEIATRLKLRSISEIFRVIIVMQRRGWVFRDPKSDKVTVTYKVLELAFRATPAQELTTVASPLMHELAQDIDQSCHLVINTGIRGLVVLRQETPGPTGLVVRLGSEIPLLQSCSGHVLLAFADDAKRHEAFAGVDTETEAHGALLDRLNKVRRQGYEQMPSARTRGVTDMSYPIFGFDGTIVAALTVPFLDVIDGTQTVKRDDARVRLAACARAISSKLGDRLPANNN
ncbi:IclR family transcriptional regulator [Asticcacaulis machinosus]|uniref:IclR family transcriptional regulator n=1 Tax=Asticcacaulis machinosus TaxID=2984211 RepID=A0ABT5HH52_9CAUL|nr:IclR family transcriptional regulator [Asticcacaulis machinosus]MDC7675585.1 IclR family transcriptional regulator [Asticcacaulis machinosus]